MDKQRLIDANALQKEFEWLESVVCSCRKDDVADSLQRVKNAQTIDPETLPIVQNLREELERVTAERDAAVKELEGVVDAANEVDDFLDIRKRMERNKGGMNVEKQRDKLIELIVNAKRADPETGSFTEFLADFLLGYGVFVPDDGYDLDHLRELVEADKDGRCVVLPCKVGRSLWVHDKDGKPREMELDPPDIRCHCRDEDNLCMALCGAKKTGVCAYRLRNDGTDIGKTVFLTREAAEEALKGEQNGKDY